MLVFVATACFACNVVEAYRTRTGHRGHKCMHGIVGICGKPSACKGELKTGHCRGDSSNVCCIATAAEEPEPQVEKQKVVRTVAPSQELPKAVQKDEEVEADGNDDYHEGILQGQLQACNELWFAHRRKRCTRKVKRKFKKCKPYYLKPLHLSIKDGTFDRDFKALVGLTVKQSIQKYHSICKLLNGKPCKTLTEAMVVDLFRNAKSSQKLLLADPNLHHIYRIDVLNTNTAKSIPEAKKRCFKLLGFFKSMFHSPWYGFKPGSRNAKYVDLSGHMESVFDPNGKVVTDISLMGTFNFFGPSHAGAHWDADVVPYQEYDNYKEQFMKEWEKIRSTPEMLSRDIKDCVWRHFQTIENVLPMRRRGFPGADPGYVAIV